MPYPIGIALKRMSQTTRWCLVIGYATSALAASAAFCHLKLVPMWLAVVASLWALSAPAGLFGWFLPWLIPRWRYAYRVPMHALVRLFAFFMLPPIWLLLVLRCPYKPDAFDGIAVIGALIIQAPLT